MHVSECQNVRVNHVDITAPAESPNTDGIHVSRSQIVKIGTTNIATGDDCISVGQGAMNVTVKKVTCGPGHGFRYILLQSKQYLDHSVPNCLPLRKIQDCILNIFDFGKNKLL